MSDGSSVGLDAWVLPEVVIPQGDLLDQPYWDGLRRGELVVQRCPACQTWQWGPEWVCHRCLSFELEWKRVPSSGEVMGRIYSWERVWHPTHPSFDRAVPYVVLLVEVPDAGNIRMIGNLSGDRAGDISIGAGVRGVFEHHATHSLMQWVLH
jgi:uncharacterized OB-fold protein